MKPKGTLTVTVYWGADFAPSGMTARTTPRAPSVFNHVEKVALAKWPDLYTLEWGASRCVSIPHRSVLYIDVNDEGGGE
jgi:hypothetical protein